MADLARDPGGGLVIVVTVTEPHTGRRWTYEHRLAAEAERLAARMRAAGFRASVGRAR